MPTFLRLELCRVERPWFRMMWDVIGREPKRVRGPYEPVDGVRARPSRRTHR